ncbi:MAG: IS3 family transposase [Prevotella sp.]|nr:IS3 family transposase [Prevotella sp.]
MQRGVWRRLTKKSWRQAVDSLRLDSPKLSIGLLSGLFGKTREGYYSVSKAKRNQRTLKEDTIVKAVKDIRAEAPRIGILKLLYMLADVYPDLMIGRDKFYKLMHKHHLMLKPSRCRHTTNSNHNYFKYKNLVKGMILTRPGQLWVADITYIDTEDGVVYLHLITDAYTHEIVGWEISDSLQAIHTLAALDMAIGQAKGMDLSLLTHHSDRGSQYCCNAYVARLNEIQASISMTEDYKPTDNAIAERVNGIIKEEWIYHMNRPKDLEDARRIITDIIDFYNNRRPHMSNNMLTPAQMRRKSENVA